MKKFIVKCGDDEVVVEAEFIVFIEQELSLYIKGQVVAAFRNWDYWYEES